MIPRATTVGVLKNYRYGLNSSFLKLNDARTTVLTQRTFNSYAEDPAAAARAFQLRRSRMTVESQYNVCDTAYRKYQSAWSSLETVVNDVDNMTKNSIKTAALKALNDPTGDARAALGKELNELADTLVQTMNSKYGDNFIFSGADGQTVPFSWSESGQLLYRGVPVDTTVPDVFQDADGSPMSIQLDGNGHYVNDGSGSDYYLVKDKTTLVDSLNPPALVTAVNADGDTEAIPVNADGEYDPDGDHVLTEHGVTKISAQGYQNFSEDRLSVLADEDGNLVGIDDATGEIVTFSVDADGNILKDDGSGELAGDEDLEGISLIYTDNTDVISQADYDQLPAPPENALRDAAGNPVMFDENGSPAENGTFYLAVEEGGTISDKDYQNAVTAKEKLDYLSNEAYYVDIGLGNKENEDGELITSSAFNAALHGINFLGYGVDENGDYKNIVSLVKQMASICTSGNGQLSKEEYNELNRLTGKLEDASANLQNMHTSMDAASTKLKNNSALLEDNFYTLQEQYSGLEDVDAAEAISCFLWAQYSYNAALRVGNSILSQSLMDYLQ